MARTSPQIQIQEIDGDQVVSLEAAKQAARAYIAHDLAKIVRQMLDDGLLEVRDGRIVPTGKRHG